MLRMPYRVIALLLVVVLLWPGLRAVESPRVDTHPSGAQVTAFVQASDAMIPHEGAAPYQPLEDLLAQAVSEPPPETPGLLAAPPASSGTWTAMPPPRSLASAETGPPFLAGPLRPPCGAALAA